jgi:hypothetical protein
VALEEEAAVELVDALGERGPLLGGELRLGDGQAVLFSGAVIGSMFAGARARSRDLRASW